MIKFPIINTMDCLKIKAVVTREELKSCGLQLISILPIHAKGLSGKISLAIKKVFDTAEPGPFLLRAQLFHTSIELKILAFDVTPEKQIFYEHIICDGLS